MKSTRIQRKRTKGWKMPSNTKYVGRPSIYGNPFEVTNGDKVTPKVAVERYALHLYSFFDWQERQGGMTLEEWVSPLKGKNLACWCPLDQPCHADVLLEIANH